MRQIWNDLGRVAALAGFVAAAAFAGGCSAIGEQASTKCMNNLKQIDLATIMYVQDYDEKFPAVGKPGRTSWEAVLWPYLKSSDVFRCPLDDKGSESYAANSFTSGGGMIFGGKLAKLDGPAYTFVFVEKPGKGPGRQIDVDGGLASQSNGQPGSWEPAQHNDHTASIYAYADGHVKMLKTSETPFSAPSRPATPNPWARNQFNGAPGGGPPRPATRPGVGAATDVQSVQ